MSNVHQSLSTGMETLDDIKESITEQQYLQLANALRDGYRASENNSFENKSSPEILNISVIFDNFFNSPMRPRRQRDRNLPVQPKSAYYIFIQEKMKELKDIEEKEDIISTRDSRKIRAQYLWKTASKDIKALYKIKEQEDAERYQRERQANSNSNNSESSPNTNSEN